MSHSRMGGSTRRQRPSEGAKSPGLLEARVPPRRRRAEDEASSHIGFLDEAEAPTPGKRRRKSDAEPLDLDGVW